MHSSSHSFCRCFLVQSTIQTAVPALHKLRCAPRYNRCHASTQTNSKARIIQSSFFSVYRSLTEGLRRQPSFLGGLKASSVAGGLAHHHNHSTQLQGRIDSLSPKRDNVAGVAGETRHCLLRHRTQSQGLHSMAYRRTRNQSSHLDLSHMKWLVERAICISSATPSSSPIH